MTHPNLAVGMGLFLEELFAEDVDLYDVSTSHLQFKILCAKAATTNSRPMRGRLRKEKTKVFKHPANSHQNHGGDIHEYFTHLKPDNINASLDV